MTADAVGAQGMQTAMARLKFVDTTVRDAHQCLWATRMTTAMMLPIAERLDRAGFSRIDLMGAVQADACVRYLKENPWERIRLMRERVRNTRLCGWVRSKSLISFDVLPDDIVRLWIERNIANGIGAIAAFDGNHDLDNVIDSLKYIKKLGAEAVGVLPYSLSPVHTDELFVASTKRQVAEAGIDTMMLKDSGGLLTVDRIRTLVPAVKAALGAIPLEIHSHCMTGQAPLVYHEAARLGADVVHTSIAPLANGLAQPDTQTMLRNLEEMGFETSLDRRLIDEISQHFAAVAAAFDKPVGVPLPYDAFHYDHQVPGGMATNFLFMLEQVGMRDKHAEVLRECARVRKEFGYPMLITPYAQLVGTQAVLNVVHGERYRSVPDEVKKYALGYYGKPLAPVDPDVLDRIVENGSHKIAVQPTPPEPALPALRRKYPNASDDERLLRFMFSGSYVDDMLAAGPMPTELSLRSPLEQLIAQISERPKIRHVRIETAGTRLEVRKASS